MRCKICQIPHKNTSRHQSWSEQRSCRVCYNLCEYFSWNGNWLTEYIYSKSTLGGKCGDYGGKPTQATHNGGQN